jgi:hypothetical protein
VIALRSTRRIGAKQDVGNYYQPFIGWRDWEDFNDCWRFVNFSFCSRIRENSDFAVSNRILTNSATGWQPVLRWLPTLIVSLRNAVDAYMVAEFVRIRILLFPSEFSRIRPQAGSLCYGGCDASDERLGPAAF